MKNKETYLVPTISETLEDINSWWDIDIDERKKRKKKKKKKKKAKKKKAKKHLKKSQKKAKKRYEQEFRYQLLIKATDTACDITKMYFYKKFGSPT